MTRRLFDDSDHTTYTEDDRVMVERLPIPPLWVRVDNAWTSFASTIASAAFSKNLWRRREDIICIMLAEVTHISV